MARKYRKKAKRRSKKRSSPRFTTTVGRTKYYNWRKKVLDRDQWKCQMPGCNCNSKAKLEVHHIVRWCDARDLRYCAENGISLCKRSHKAITGQETLFEDLFNMLVILNKQPNTKTSKRI